MDTTFEYMEMFDTVPPREKGVGTDKPEEQEAEAQRYRKLLLKVYPAPEGCALEIKENPHDLGTYVSLEAWGDPENDAHWEWVNSLSDIPTWEKLEAAAAKKS